MQLDNLTLKQIEEAFANKKWIVTNVSNHRFVEAVDENWAVYEITYSEPIHIRKSDGKLYADI